MVTRLPSYHISHPRTSSKYNSSNMKQYKSHKWQSTQLRSICIQVFELNKCRKPNCRNLFKSSSTVGDWRKLMWKTRTLRGSRSISTIQQRRRRGKIMIFQWSLLNNYCVSVLLGLSYNNNAYLAKCIVLASRAYTVLSICTFVTYYILFVCGQLLSWIWSLNLRYVSFSFHDFFSLLHHLSTIWTCYKSQGKKWISCIFQFQFRGANWITSPVKFWLTPCSFVLECL